MEKLFKIFSKKILYFIFVVFSIYGFYYVYSFRTPALPTSVNTPDNNLTATSGNKLTLSKWNSLIQRVSSISTNIDGNAFFTGGNVGIGVSNTNAKLEINGLLKTKNIFHNVLQVLHPSTTTHGIKIKTNIPWLNSSYMPTIIIEGYDYINSKTIGLLINFYVFNDNFTNLSASSYGGSNPIIKLARENGKIVIFISNNQGNQYYNNFTIKVLEMITGNTSYYNNWTYADESLSGDKIVTVPYFNRTGTLYVDNNLGIGTTLPSQKLEVSGNGLCTGGTSCWLTSSDIKLKTNIKELNYGINEIIKINPVSFDWIGGKNNDIGLIAQEIEQIIPQIVHTGSDGYKSVGYSALVPVLIQAIKDLKNENNKNINEIELLKSRLQELEKNINNIKN